MNEQLTKAISTKRNCCICKENAVWAVHQIYTSGVYIRHFCDKCRNSLFADRLCDECKIESVNGCCDTYEFFKK